MRPAVAAVLAVLAGCHAADYRGPSWDPPWRNKVSAGCVELSTGFVADGVDQVPGIPLWLSFHSHCKVPVPIDVRRVRVTARLPSGAWAKLVPYDPRRELRTGLLAPGDIGNEPIEYDAPDGSLDGWSKACVDFGAVRPDMVPVVGAVVCLDREPKPDAPDVPAPATETRPAEPGSAPSSNGDWP